MADSVAFNSLTIQSHSGPYQVFFEEEIGACLRSAAETSGRPERRFHYLVDAKIARLYARELASALGSSSVIEIEATESHKSLEQIPRYVEHLLTREVRRGDVLVAIGGGILQDITCFLAATLLRGLEWRFIPTTLLAQADSCIGSKSSINAGAAKNVLGTFTPPRSVVVCLRFLDSLDERDVRSGIGEMLKVHAIESPESFDRIAADYRRLFERKSVMAEYVGRSLEIKKRIIEADEFDRGPRNVMNYGHTFGHAVEAATDFAVPHGIAVAIGMDMANFIAVRLGRADQAHAARMHPILKANFAGFERLEIPMDRFMSAIAKDKKNTRAQLGLILLDREGRPSRVFIDNDEKFQAWSSEYLRSGRS